MGARDGYDEAQVEHGDPGVCGCAVDEEPGICSLTCCPSCTYMNYEGCGILTVVFFLLDITGVVAAYIIIDVILLPLALDNVHQTIQRNRAKMEHKILGNNLLNAHQKKKFHDMENDAVQAGLSMAQNTIEFRFGVILAHLVVWAFCHLLPAAYTCMCWKVPVRGRSQCAVGAPVHTGYGAV